MYQWTKSGNVPVNPCLRLRVNTDRVRAFRMSVSSGVLQGNGRTGSVMIPLSLQDRNKRMYMQHTGLGGLCRTNFGQNYGVYQPNLSRTLSNLEQDVSCVCTART